MIGMNINVDKSSTEFISRLAGSFSAWDTIMYHELSKHLANTMVEFIKPKVRSVVGNGTGESEKSIRADVNNAHDGFDIGFFGTLGAFYMDEGNFAADATIYRVDQQNHPVGARNGGAIFFSPYIHGMGYRTPSTPTHYSDMAADEWESGDTLNIAEQSLINWLDEVVIV